MKSTKNMRRTKCLLSLISFLCPGLNSFAVPIEDQQKIQSSELEPQQDQDSCSQSKKYDVVIITNDLLPPGVAQLEKLKLALRVAKKVKIFIYASENSPLSIASAKSLWDILFKTFHEQEMVNTHLKILRSQPFKPLLARSKIDKKIAWVVSPDLFGLASQISLIRDHLGFSSIDMISTEGIEDSLDYFEDIRSYHLSSGGRSLAEIKAKYYPEHLGFDRAMISRTINIIKNGYQDIDWSRHLFKHLAKTSLDKFFDQLTDKTFLSSGLPLLEMDDQLMSSEAIQTYKNLVIGSFFYWARGMRILAQKLLTSLMLLHLNSISKQMKYQGLTILHRGIHNCLVEYISQSRMEMREVNCVLLSDANIVQLIRL